MKGRTVVITGANTGIGLETAAALAAMGARVVLTARDPLKGSVAAEKIRRRYPDANVIPMELDLARLGDVRSFAADLLERFGALHVLVNNAGVMLGRRSTTVDGFETTFQVNHLAPFLLTNLLLDRLRASGPSRIINVASEAHRAARLDFDDLNSERGYRGMRVYVRTKLCNILFTRALASRLLGTGVTANALHPGTVRTALGRDGDTSAFFTLGIKITGPLLLSPARGARTTIHLASSPDVEGRTGEYWIRRRPRKPASKATDDEAARRLWDVSAQLVGR
ncbi:MAG: SDR family oxidoreductase [Chloroflexi bacterium]|nr:MAG: SDR family oxidoreductase [Chloroflexota bacterium]